MHWNRRSFLKTSTAALSAAAAAPGLFTGTHEQSQESASASQGFAQRGYYITFMRGTRFSFAAWKQIFDAVRTDGGNLIVLWMAGAFPSRKFPITWKYNAEHENIQHNFAGQLIDYGHALGIKVLLGLTPFAYDGVNQYAWEHPELKAISKNGNFVAAFGLGSWGFNLNPYRPESQRFMLEYTRELLEFYPNADGLLLESNDYQVSYCAGCSETYYQKEFEFVRQISSELWERKPGAMILVYPHYFSDQQVPGLDVHSAKEPFDSRWGLFLPRSISAVDPALLKKASAVVYWDPSPTFGNPRQIQVAAQKARAIGASGFVPSFEPWTYVLQGPDMGDQFMVGHRLAPFGFAWLAAGESPAGVLLMRTDRLAYREFSRNPDLSMEAFRQVLSLELFDGKSTPELIDDLLFLEESFFLDRTWVSVAAIASPEYVKGMLDAGKISAATLTDYRNRRGRIAQMALRYERAQDPATQELRQIAQWIVTQWQASPVHKYVDAHIG